MTENEQIIGLLMRIARALEDSAREIKLLREAIEYMLSEADSASWERYQDSKNVIE